MVRKDGEDYLSDELKTCITEAKITIKPPECDLFDISRFNNYDMMLRVTSRVSYIASIKSLKVASTLPTLRDRKKAESNWIKKVNVACIPSSKTDFVD